MKLAAFLVLFLAGCDRRETTCAATGEIPGKACFTECSAKRTRAIECTGDEKDGWGCACLVNGKLGRSFQLEPKK